MLRWLGLPAGMEPQILCSVVVGLVAAVVRAPDQGGRADHRHPSGDRALLHDHPRGGPTRVAGLGAWRDAARMGSRVFVLDMGQPVRIADLARQMTGSPACNPSATLPSTSPDCVRARSCSRSCSMARSSSRRRRCHGSMSARPGCPDLAALVGTLTGLETACAEGRIEEGRRTLSDLVPDYVSPPPALCGRRPGASRANSSHSGVPARPDGQKGRSGRRARASNVSDGGLFCLCFN